MNKKLLVTNLYIVSTSFLLLVVIKAFVPSSDALVPSSDALVSTSFLLLGKSDGRGLMWMDGLLCLAFDPILLQ